jgi:hypothetical protein
MFQDLSNDKKNIDNKIMVEKIVISPENIKGKLDSSTVEIISSTPTVSGVEFIDRDKIKSEKK